MLTKGHINYLHKLVEKEITWRETMLANFSPRDGQTMAEAEYKRSQIERHLSYSQHVLDELDELIERARKIAERREEEERTAA